MRAREFAKIMANADPDSAVVVIVPGVGPAKIGSIKPGSAGVTPLTAISLGGMWHPFDEDPIDCQSRFIKQRLKDPEQDERMRCARPAGHRVRHKNKSGDLQWSLGLEIDLSDLLDDAYAHTEGTQP